MFTNDGVRIIKIHHEVLISLEDMIHEQPLCQEVKRNRSRVTDGEIFMETRGNTTRPGHLTTSLEVRETVINWNILFDGTVGEIKPRSKL